MNKNVGDFVETFDVGSIFGEVDGVVEGANGRLVHRNHERGRTHVAVELNEGETTSIRAFENFIDEENVCRRNRAEEERGEAQFGARVDIHRDASVSDGFSFAV